MKGDINYENPMICLLSLCVYLFIYSEYQINIEGLFTKEVFDFMLIN